MIERWYNHIQPNKMIQTNKIIVVVAVSRSKLRALYKPMHRVDATGLVAELISFQNVSGDVALSIKTGLAFLWRFASGQFITNQSWGTTLLHFVEFVSLQSWRSLCRTTLSHLKHPVAKWKQWPASRRIEGRCLMLTLDQSSAFPVFNHSCTSSTSKARSWYQWYPLIHIIQSYDIIHLIHLVPFPRFSHQASQEAFLIAGLLFLTGRGDSLLIFGRVLALLTRDTLLAAGRGGFNRSPGT